MKSLMRNGFHFQISGCPAPRVIEVPCPGFTVKIRLDFEQEFSNKLNIYTTVIDPGLAEVCSAWICGIPNVMHLILVPLNLYIFIFSLFLLLGITPEAVFATIVATT